MNEEWRHTGYRTGITCCKDCVAPKRHFKCHETCEEYKNEKAQFEQTKENIKKMKENFHTISEYDFNKY